MKNVDGWELGVHDTWEVVEHKLLRVLTREQSWLRSLFLWGFHRCHLTAGLYAAFLRREPLLRDLTCPCFGPDLHQVEASSHMHVKVRLRCLKLRVGWLTQSRSETVLISSFSWPPCVLSWVSSFCNYNSLVSRGMCKLCSVSMYWQHYKVTLYTGQTQGKQTYLMRL